eukprot:TRINITY_DN22953_c0_g2_i2.p1 TRINITY_DN22953_c0_g2~~TRINITY_DN22953_c0_g2_i2.p1  ORF type:complete len:301 (+),score=9.11 TRINITY_DN22953_c0_g2_i2:1-903(+)
MVGEAERRYNEAISSGATAPTTAPKWEAKDLESASGKYDIVTCLDVMIHYPQDKVDAMIGHLASLSSDKLILSFAPWTLQYSILKRIGELFPGPSKATRAYLHREDDVVKALERNGFKVTKGEMTATSFYFSRLLEAQRVQCAPIAFQNVVILDRYQVCRASLSKQSRSDNEGFSALIKDRRMSLPLSPDAARRILRSFSARSVRQPKSVAIIQFIIPVLQREQLGNLLNLLNLGKHLSLYGVPYPSTLVTSLCAISGLGKVDDVSTDILETQANFMPGVHVVQQSPLRFLRGRSQLVRA